MSLKGIRPPLDIEPVTLGKLSPDEVATVVVCSGYEPRCTMLLHHLRDLWNCSPPDLGQKVLLLEFDSQDMLPSRQKSDQYFRDYRPRHRLRVSKGSGAEVVQLIQGLARSDQQGSRVALIDYSCMSRTLYLSLVPLAYRGFNFVFSYSVGQYGPSQLEYPISAVGTIKPVSGLEGLSSSSRPTLHVIGLGFDGKGTLALVDRLEASRLAVFWADPGATVDAGKIAREQNRDLVERALFTFSRDLRDVSGTASVLSRIAFELADTDNVVFAPVGPKPQILASALAAAPYDHCKVLAPYLGKGGIREGFPLIEASGEFIATRVKSPQM